MSVLEQQVRLPAWRRYAACRGRTRLMYDSSELGQRIALAVCAGCGVQQACLRAALSEEAGLEHLHGIRAGRTPSERRQLLAAG